MRDLFDELRKAHQEICPTTGRWLSYLRRRFIYKPVKTWVCTASPRAGRIDRHAFDSWVTRTYPAPLAKKIRDATSTLMWALGRAGRFDDFFEPPIGPCFATALDISRRQMRTLGFSRRMIEEDWRRTFRPLFRWLLVTKEHDGILDFGAARIWARGEMSASGNSRFLVGLRRLKKTLTECGVFHSYCRETNHTTDPSSWSSVIASFIRYEQESVGVLGRTATKYARTASAFIKWRFGGDARFEDRIEAGDVCNYLIHVRRNASLYHAANSSTALRRFFRFLYLKKHTAIDHTALVPRVSKPHDSGIIRAISRQDAISLLKSAKGETIACKRNYAALLLFDRLALRAHEAIHLRLQDIDWEKCEITVSAKGRTDTMPMPTEVAEALASYLQVRPECTSDCVFIRLIAPHHGLQRNGFSSVVTRIAQKSQLRLRSFGTHQFRHGLATNMLNHGASLQNVSDTLRHRTLLTSSIYAKANIQSLKKAVTPCPQCPKITLT